MDSAGTLRKRRLIIDSEGSQGQSRPTPRRGPWLVETETLNCPCEQLFADLSSGSHVGVGVAPNLTVLQLSFGTVVTSHTQASRSLHRQP
jgi:hypothetical protein